MMGFKTVLTVIQSAGDVERDEPRRDAELVLRVADRPLGDDHRQQRTHPRDQRPAGARRVWCCDPGIYSRPGQNVSGGHQRDEVVRHDLRPLPGEEQHRQDQPGGEDDLWPGLTP